MAVQVKNLTAQNYMNTYRLEPKKKFNCTLVNLILKEIVMKHCYGHKYDSSTCPSVAQTVSAEILQQVKKLGFDRYRLLVFVQIGGNKRQGIQTATKYLWDNQRDAFTTYTLMSASMFTSATCFGIYKD